jgi:DNA-binding winged helix-turn-helix (wHTH) protein
MHYRFNGFEFNSVNLLLTKNGEALDIRHTEARVLALLLEYADTVLNKEDILSHVWQDKVVSEQVVFQNISHLRSIFGNGAIKTFPKRGYQWQLEVEATSLETHPTESSQRLLKVHKPLPRSSFSILVKRRSFEMLAVLFGIFLITIAAIYLKKEPLGESTDLMIKLAYIPIASLNDEYTTEHTPFILEDNTDLVFTELTHLDRERFTHAMEIEYAKLSSAHPFVLTGIFRTYKQQAYVDFMVKGPFADWEGQLSGLSKKEVIEQLQQHLKQLFIYELISKPQPPELKQAMLSIAHQASPNDLIILAELTIAYYETDELEKAMAMADKLISIAESQNNTQHIGRALLYQSKILRKKQLYDLSAQKLKLSIALFEDINDLEHQSQAWYFHSRLDHKQKDYTALKASLLKSSLLAYGADNKLGEIEVLIHLAMMAHYYQNDDDKYLYLQQAESKMNTYQLPIYHFARISYRYATFAKTLSEKEPHLKQVLKLASLTPEDWAAQSSRRQLMQQYIAQGRLADAQALINGVTSDNGNNSYLKTLMAQAKQQKNKMISHAQRTFEQAQLAGNRSLSLDAALLLCKQQINCDFYSQYINDNATASWRSMNDIK